MPTRPVHFSVKTAQFNARFNRSIGCQVRLFAIPCPSSPTSPAGSVFPCGPATYVFWPLQPRGWFPPATSATTWPFRFRQLLLNRNSQKYGLGLSRFSFSGVQSDLRNCKTTFFLRLDSTPNVRGSRPVGRLPEPWAQKARGRSSSLHAMQRASKGKLAISMPAAMSLPAEGSRPRRYMPYRLSRPAPLVPCGRQAMSCANGSSKSGFKIVGQKRGITARSWLCRKLPIW
jgi:hypothetical protein